MTLESGRGMVNPAADPTTPARAAKTGVGPAAAAAFLLLAVVACDPVILREENEAAGFNGGFEFVQAVRGIDAVRQGLPANWYFHAKPLLDGDAELSLDAGGPSGGAWSLRLDVQEADSVAGARTTGLYQVVPARPLGTYRVGFSLKIRDDARALVVIRSESANEATPGRVQVYDEEHTGRDTWRRFEYVYSVPEGFENIRFELNVIRPGTVWLDEVRIEEIAT